LPKTAVVQPSDETKRLVVVAEVPVALVNSIGPYHAEVADPVGQDVMQSSPVRQNVVALIVVAKRDAPVAFEKFRVETVELPALKLPVSASVVPVASATTARVHPRDVANRDVPVPFVTVS